jgi:hypothetical protein
LILLLSREVNNSLESDSDVEINQLTDISRVYPSNDNKLGFAGCSLGGGCSAVFAIVKMVRED